MLNYGVRKLVATFNLVQHGVKQRSKLTTPRASLEYHTGIMFPKVKELNVPTWVLGKELRGRC
jgi:hypothetical protein